MTAARWSLLLALLVACRAGADGGLVNPLVQARYEAESVSSLAFSRTGDSSSRRASTEPCRSWDPATGKEKTRLATFKSGLYATAFSTAGKQVAAERRRRGDPALGRHHRKGTWNLDGTHRCRDLSGLLPRRQNADLGEHRQDVRFWDIAAQKEIRKITAHEEGVLSVGLTSDNLLLSTGEQQGVLGGGHFVVMGADKPRLWDLATGKEMRSYNVEAGLAMLSYDRRFLATDGVETKLMGGSLSQRKLFALRDAATGRVLTEFKTPMCYWIAFAPDGKLLASVDSERRLRLWEAVTGQEVYRLSDWPGSSLAFAATANVLPPARARVRCCSCHCLPNARSGNARPWVPTWPDSGTRWEGADAAVAYSAYGRWPRCRRGPSLC